MEFRRQTALLIVALSLLASAPAAMAENWQAVGTHSEVDVDSIHKADDGLVHYMDRDPPKAGETVTLQYIYEEAFDCEKQISYVGLDEVDWQTKGVAVKPDTRGSTLMDFVCSRVPIAAPAPSAEQSSELPAAPP